MKNIHTYRAPRPYDRAVPKANDAKTGKNTMPYMNIETMAIRAEKDR